MIYGLKVISQYVLGTDRAERNFSVRDDDTFVVSYPRSGNTWTRFLIANLVHPKEDVTFANIERFIPDTSSQSNRVLKRTPSPRIIKTHQYFDHRYPKVIYIVRDPRDVALSYYDFQRKYRQIQDDYPIDRYVEDFVQGRISSRDWGTWGENVASWVATRSGNEGFLLLRYEDMIANTVHNLARIAAFLNVSANQDRLQEVAERSSADRMRELEQRQSQVWVATKNRRNDIPFVRTAKAGGWKTLLPAVSVSSIESAWGDVMKTVGYDLSNPFCGPQFGTSRGIR
jgi:Sulfotransferase domain